ncbi:MAG: penicillin-binding protein [Burkholderiales bacterium PBB3]|nr:MAG: penicillin-binding protein [Burkholderiales bacterium PBB3]
MQRYVDQDILAGASYAILRGQDILDMQCVGWADKESNTHLRTDHIFRAMSNTKLITSMAVMLLWEEGRIHLDEPIGKFIAQLADLKVLKPGASRLDETEPARSPITIRHLLTHSSGLSYGLLDPGSLLFNAYNERRVINPHKPLISMMDALSDLPLMFQPGASWEYSVATDVLGYLVEVVSGQDLEQFFKSRIFDVLGMEDTAFTLPPEKHSRLATCYAGADGMDPMKPGLRPVDTVPWRGAYLQPFPLKMGGGGLATTLPDMVALVRSLVPGGKSVLKPETITAMMTNQLPEGRNIQFARFGEIRGKGYGLGGAVTLKPSAIDPRASTGEFQWGGLAGTHWWISPQTGLVGVLMAQRQMGFWNPFSFEFKQLAYRAAGH